MYNTTLNSNLFKDAPTINSWYTKLANAQALINNYSTGTKKNSIEELCCKTLVIDKSEFSVTKKIKISQLYKKKLFHQDFHLTIDKYVVLVIFYIFEDLDGDRTRFRAHKFHFEVDRKLLKNYDNLIKVNNLTVWLCSKITNFSYNHYFFNPKSLLFVTNWESLTVEAIAKSFYWTSNLHYNIINSSEELDDNGYLPHWMVESFLDDPRGLNTDIISKRKIRIRYHKNDVSIIDFSEKFSEQPDLLDLNVRDIDQDTALANINNLHKLYLEWKSYPYKDNICFRYSDYTNVDMQQKLNNFNFCLSFGVSIDVDQLKHDFKKFDVGFYLTRSLVTVYPSTDVLYLDYRFRDINELDHPIRHFKNKNNYGSADTAEYIFDKDPYVSDLNLQGMKHASSTLDISKPRDKYSLEKKNMEKKEKKNLLLV